MLKNIIISSVKRGLMQIDSRWMGANTHANLDSYMIAQQSIWTSMDSLIKLRW